ncbi:hypothetical protein SLEP1_g16728 [Rubroshorea leprosula]|uniref:B30.2/SPRY domain-containing protein n=1 Tax=Rubroshorea leprosula TaxID=152421 RepID=A0AAV5J2D2_9ROSI|nr:hypothetical protein SLEP1_g16728 [Rubroshorea leprosula]
MIEWMNIALPVVAAVFLASSLGIFVWRWCCYKQRRDFSDRTRASLENSQAGILKLQQPSLHHQLDLDGRKVGNYYVLRRGVSAKPLFNWADHPSLVTEAVENGWSRFGFTSYIPSPSTRSNLLGICAAGEYGRGNDVEVSWEVCQGSEDFMQKIRLNSGLKKAGATQHSTGAAAAIRTALPLPGPPLGDSAFPQEAYFEITILYCRRRDNDLEGERIKLIHENFKAMTNSDSEETKLESDAVMMSVGLTAGGPLPLKLPGSYPGSIGFNSDGSVFLDGIEAMFGSEKEDWGKPEKVIGCGFDPRQKKVFFTVDSELVHVINCKTEEFGSPLYPTLAANDDVLVLVNFGQSAFMYSPANAHRTSNPCFIGPLVNTPSLGLEDSKELFSMGRIDSQWLHRNLTKGSLNGGTNNSAMEFDEESEADLFEIVLDSHSTRRSPNRVL